MSSAIFNGSIDNDSNFLSELQSEVDKVTGIIANLLIYSLELSLLLMKLIQK